MKIEQTECSKTSAYKIQMPGNYPEESIQHSEHGEILKSITLDDVLSSIRTGRHLLNTSHKPACLVPVTWSTFLPYKSYCYK